ncbi:NADH dehydrogenase subunit 4L (mitochondrion) [Neolecta irregularis DAH-3]|uniref:NADH dehydrogenase subunit 4L n=1 Tax=Neolecta irregularis (strain DAH-3) TaxID=1198029 RepID=A0A1U7LGC8_NEOID|nr:NADH dehydrogenase subunit 4L [Neolecta irregularis DAH-3]|eukprot:OLL21602.1 NADH dehydrogenase subunit 4L (mitochondrion) [Neolecta irregularis DAH-3]
MIAYYRLRGTISMN